MKLKQIIETASGTEFAARSGSNAATALGNAATAVSNAKRTLTWALACCLLACSLVLAGCSSGPSYDEEQVKSTFVGTWTISKVYEGGTEVAADDIAYMKKLKVDVTATFNDDYTFRMDLYGDTLEGTYEVTDENEILTNISSYDNMNGYLDDDGSLVLDDGSSQIIMTKE